MDNQKYPGYLALFPKPYVFMGLILGLSGAVKETFAVIFGLWLKNDEQPVPVSITLIQIVICATRPTVVHAIDRIVRLGYVAIEKKPGKKNRYSVTIDPELLAEVKRQLKEQGVKPFNQKECNPLTSSGKDSYIQYKEHKKTDNPLKVKPAEKMSIGGLKKA